MVLKFFTTLALFWVSVGWAVNPGTVTRLYHQYLGEETKKELDANQNLPFDATLRDYIHGKAGKRAMARAQADAAAVELRERADQAGGCQAKIGGSKR